MNNWKNEKNLTPGEIRKAVEQSDIAADVDLSGSGVVCALLNSDTRGVLLPILKDDPEKVLKGMSLAAVAIGADEAFLYVPDYADDVAEAVKDLCGQYNVVLERGIVDVRKREGFMMLHIAEAARICELFSDGYKPGWYVSPEGGAPVKADFNTKISDLVKLDGAKAVISGNEILLPEEADKTVGELKPADGYIHAVGASECIVVTVGKMLEASGKQSCGKCVFCREGLIQLQYMHKEFTLGRGKAEYIDLIKEIGEGMLTQTPCTMGQQSAIPALTATEKFEAIYKAHIKKNCDICFSKEAIYIDPKLCQGCEECADVCPHDCIEGKAKFIHMIDDFDCDLCGKCIEACEYDAIIRTTGKVPKLPNKLTKVGRFKK